MLPLQLQWVAWSKAPDLILRHHHPLGFSEAYGGQSPPEKAGQTHFEVFRAVTGDKEPLAGKS